jgi:hypothetical protein
VACLERGDVRNFTDTTNGTGNTTFGISLAYTEANRGLASMPGGYTNRLFYDGIEVITDVGRERLAAGGSRGVLHDWTGPGESNVVHVVPDAEVHTLRLVMDADDTGAESHEDNTFGAAVYFSWLREGQGCPLTPPPPPPPPPPPVPPASPVFTNLTMNIIFYVNKYECI